MTENPYSFDPSGTEITSDDRLWAFLAYLLSPLIPVILLLMEDKRDRPYLKAHTMQALVLGLINVAIGTVIGWTIIFSCVPLFIWLLMVYWGIQAYQGKYVTIPVITDFVNNQGWV